MTGLRIKFIMMSGKRIHFGVAMDPVHPMSQKISKRIEMASR